MYNPGYVVVSLGGFNFSAHTTGGIPGLYESMDNAKKTGKPVVVKDFVTENNADGGNSPAPATICHVSDGSIVVHTSFAVFSVDSDNVLTVFTIIPPTGG